MSVSTSLARGRFTEVCRAGLDATRFRRELRARLERLVGFDAYCVNTVDPDSLEVTSSIGDGLAPEDGRRLFELEARGDDVNRLVTLRGVATASEATRDDVVRSIRMREIFLPLGLRDELRAPLAIDGVTWGFLHLFRAGRFAQTEIANDVTREIAGALRAAHLGPDAPPMPPGVIFRDLPPGYALAEPEAAAWLDRFGEDVGGAFPHALYARRPARHRLPAGGWVALHPSARTVTLMTPRRDELAPLLFRAHALTPREREVATLVAAGHSNASIAGRLGLRLYTAKDHLNAVFAKTRATDRAELARRFG